MILEYLIKDEKEISAVKDYSSDVIEQGLYKIGAVQILSISTQSQNLDSARVLSTIHNEIEQTHKFVVLSNGPSEYFNKMLFPYINKFERQLRKLLYLASVLKEKEKISGLKNIKNLEKKNLGEIFNIMFTDKELNYKMRNLFADANQQFSKKHILEYIKSLDENTLWNKLIGPDVSELSNIYNTVKEYRNQIMHAHNIDYDRYLNIKKTFTKINGDIEILIIGISNSDGEVFKRLKEFNRQLSEVFKIQSELISLSVKPLAELFIKQSKEISDTVLALQETTKPEEFVGQLASLQDVCKNLYPNSIKFNNFQNLEASQVEFETVDEEE